MPAGIKALISLETFLFVAMNFTPFGHVLGRFFANSHDTMRMVLPVKISGATMTTFARVAELEIVATNASVLVVRSLSIPNVTRRRGVTRMPRVACLVIP